MIESIIEFSLKNRLLILVLATLVMVAGMGIYQWIQQRRQRSA